jgi:hypothetical protein
MFQPTHFVLILKFSYLKHFSKLKTTNLVATLAHPQIIIIKLIKKIDFFPQTK